MARQTVTTNTRPVRASSAPTGIYSAAEPVLVRAPVLPADTHTLPRASAAPVPTVGSLLPEDPWIRSALAVGSGDLFDALAHTGDADADSRRLRGKMLRYLIRMSTRPTPFGMFAGVAVARWGTATDLSIAAGPPATRTRPDMEWLLRLVFTLESAPAVRGRLRYQTHSCVFERCERFFLDEPAPGSHPAATERSAVSVSASQAVRCALAAAYTGVPHEDLARILEKLPGATPERVDALITGLWKHTFLLTDLRPPLTAAQPACYVMDRLRDVPAAQETRRCLGRLLTAMARWDELAVENRPEGYRELRELARAVDEAAERLAGASASKGPGGADRRRHPAQVDLTLRLGGQEISPLIGEEAARAAETLLRLSPWPSGMPILAGYAQAFEHRYGTGREVPLLELLSPDFGLGPPSAFSSSIPAAGQTRPERHRTLRDMALDALREGRRTVRLTDDLVERLQTCSPDTRFPRSMDLSVFVLAASAAAIDAGDFRLVVGPNLGAAAAGRNAARFALALGPEATAALHRLASAEARGSGRLWAEMSYLPEQLRSANVLVRPLVRSHEIVVGTTPGTSRRFTVPLGELTVTVRDGQLRLRWPRRGVDVVACSGHMLNTLQAPAVCRFLEELRLQGRPQPCPFDWGPAGDFPFLPRVERGRTVLAPAQWRPGHRLASPPRDFTGALETWRRQWCVPRYVYLTEGDNRLLLDLEEPDQAEQLRTACDTAPEATLLQEALPALSDAWTPGPRGHHIVELMVPLVLKNFEDEPEGHRPKPVVSERSGSAPRLADRLKPPGSDWLFAKLYCPEVFAVDLITSQIASFSRRAVADGLTADWFFLRYADPDFHLRLRLRGDPEILRTELASHLFTWGSSLLTTGMCTRLSLDTYEREVDRYGGPEGTEVAELVFAADSAATADLLALDRDQVGLIDRTLLAVLAVDDLLACLGLDGQERLAWYRDRVGPGRAAGDEYRRRKTALRSLLADCGRLPAEAGGARAAEILEARRDALAGPRERLAGLRRSGRLTTSVQDMCASFAHLSCNRLLGRDWPSEEHLLGLLLRTRRALEAAPVDPRGERPG
ncbi:lantibiotic dehydratase [Streptomyces pseudogriseolus]|uniref:lantibiotic dehydratase n=1 Tax=Streptomyces pseudogriseolus TaxID=36817 RepID=UPI003FA3257C